MDDFSLARPAGHLIMGDGSGPDGLATKDGAKALSGAASVDTATTQVDQPSRTKNLITEWLGNYESGTPGVETGDNSTARLDLDNEPQPDAVLLIDPACGGQAHISADDYLEGAPEFVAEVTASSVSIDLHTKFQIYQRSGVHEYLVWRVLEQAVDWFVLHAGQYERLVPDAQGVLRSEVFPGLWLDTAALLRGDIAAVLATVHHGLASPEHAAFVARLHPPSL
jgi:Uma2 family endonuclease